MEYSKVGVENSGNSKLIATAAHQIDTGGDEEQTIQSRRAVGHSWKISSADDVSDLFGAGGWQDGATALIATYKNKQIEDSMALDGNGERVIDDNIHAHNVSNANTEFNFSQYKNGMMTYSDPEPRFNVTHAVASGDIALRIDPYSSTFDETTQALGSIMNPKYKLNGKSEVDQSNDQRTGVNPFNGASRTDNQKDYEAQGLGMIDPEQEDEDEISYYYNDGLYDPSAAQDIQMNMETGLRKTNARKSQSTILERVAQRDDIMSAINNSQEMFANVLKDHFSDVYRTSEESGHIRESLRHPSSKYVANQVGVNEVSRSSQQSYKNKKHKVPTKLNPALISV